MFLPRNEGTYRHMRLNYKVKIAKRTSFIVQDLITYIYRLIFIT